MKRLRWLRDLAACGLVVAAGPVLADAGTDWNAIAQTTIAANCPGAPGALDSALVQIAVHDAVQALDHRFEPIRWKSRCQRLAVCGGRCRGATTC